MELTACTSLRVTEGPAVVRATLCRPSQQNVLHPGLLQELHAVLDHAEAQPDCRLVVLEGEGGVFSMGMDVGSASRAGTPTVDQAARGAEDFMALMRRLTTTPRLVVSVVDGQVAGGGVGLVAASDLVYATERSRFSLPEALWGLLPCCVAPFLIRRVGFQPAYSLTLTTAPIGAREAARARLVDEVADDPDALVRRLTYRMTKIDEATLGRAKRYMSDLGFLDARIERLAVEEFAAVMTSATARARLDGFASDHRLPWEA